MEIRIQGHDESALIAGILEDGRAFGSPQADVAGVDNVDAVRPQMVCCGPRQPLVEQDPPVYGVTGKGRMRSSRQAAA